MSNMPNDIRNMWEQAAGMNEAKKLAGTLTRSPDSPQRAAAAAAARAAAAAAAEGSNKDKSHRGNKDDSHRGKNAL